MKLIKITSKIENILYPTNISIFFYYKKEVMEELWDKHYFKCYICHESPIYRLTDINFDIYSSMPFCCNRENCINLVILQAL